MGGFYPGRDTPIFPGRVIAQETSGLIGWGGELKPGWGTPLSESGRVRERQVGCRQPVGGMGFAPAGRPIFRGRAVAKGASGPLRWGGGLYSGWGTPTPEPGRVTAQDNSGLIGRGGVGLALAGRPIFPG